MASILLRTSVPGPLSCALQQRRERSVPRGVASASNIFVASAEGAVIEDVDGNRFLDFGGGIGCLNIGHRHPEVVEAIHAQVDRFLHVCSQVTPYESYVALAEKLNSIAPGDSPKKTFLVNSGAEAVENAIKIARAYTRRSAVLCFENAFHGRTMFALALTSKTHPYKAEFGPFSGEVYRLPASPTYRTPQQKPVETMLDEAFRSMIAAETVAAVIIEPVFGEGGFLVQTPEFLHGLRERCTRHGILFIADEIQTGFSRTGAMFACERFGIEPDLLICAKSLGGGMPIAAVTGKSEMMDAPSAGGLGGTFGGNPVSCAAALATILAMEKENLAARAEMLGRHFKARASGWQKRFPLVGDVRGLGAMVAIELVRAGDRLAPADLEAKAVARFCYEHGVILLTTGTYGNVVRLLFPLVITYEELEEGLDVMEAALAYVTWELPVEAASA